MLEVNVDAVLMGVSQESGFNVCHIIVPCMCIKMKPVLMNSTLREKDVDTQTWRYVKAASHKRFIIYCLSHCLGRALAASLTLLCDPSFSDIMSGVKNLD